MTIRYSSTGRDAPLTGPRLSGPEKVAILFLCLGEQRGSELMQRLEEGEIQRITLAMSGLGPIPAEVAEDVLAEFAETVASGGMPLGTYETARKMLGAFLPDDKIDAMLQDVRPSARESDIWQRLNQMDEKVLARHFAVEKVATVATILSCLSPEVAARVLPLLEEDQMLRVLERMMRMEDPPNHLVEQIESALREDLLESDDDASAIIAHKRMADIFNKLDPALFDNVSVRLSDRAPDDFQAIKKRMFTFDDMIRIDGPGLARIMRGVPGNTVPLALRGTPKELRDHFLSALPTRSRDMLVEEMDAMGPVRARDVRAAQGLMVDYARELIRAEVIRLPSDDEEEEELIE
ncbi:flagellar motor switch protein FliG [Roseibacterium sp. SDUM158017]|uniref:flagellar motor switch protein FliG n=1 Tax=Roseicyclus salinarum TaxID=3036773 RepID=UPI002414FDCC|nr:flagellar motor switch protein FliG [Roseibacterium sp. SDUM158017]MDG4648638.1 flagellar motor switch protein FliG [Roseibacterium sp. SDUM158017]